MDYFHILESTKYLLHCVSTQFLPHSGTGIGSTIRANKIETSLLRMFIVSTFVLILMWAETHLLCSLMWRLNLWSLSAWSHCPPIIYLWGSSHDFRDSEENLISFSVMELISFKIKSIFKLLQIPIYLNFVTVFVSRPLSHCFTWLTHLTGKIRVSEEE